jgi:hypothetical protein
MNKGFSIGISTSKDLGQLLASGAIGIILPIAYCQLFSYGVQVICQDAEWQKNLAFYRETAQ